LTNCFVPGILSGRNTFIKAANESPHTNRISWLLLFYNNDLFPRVEIQNAFFSSYFSGRASRISHIGFHHFSELSR